ncbi:hypothetical protein MLD38_009908 [Melastoma candidum]|uniref:Uncharacterized protein n=1 Tax=Melastoma candidum TaxID=119954 RepID=A0ACB9QYB7_9MYRT|nr:hypothetical protein MLD38_009908 [Melastoma candidum]
MAAARLSPRIVRRGCLLLPLFIASSVISSMAALHDEKGTFLVSSAGNSTFQADALEFRPNDPRRGDGTADYNAWQRARGEGKGGGTRLPRWRDRSFGFSAHEVPSGPNPESN